LLDGGLELARLALLRVTEDAGEGAALRRVEGCEAVRGLSAELGLESVADTQRIVRRVEAWGMSSSTVPRERWISYRSRANGHYPQESRNKS
jgi:hypothetical protein